MPCATSPARTTLRACRFGCCERACAGAERGGVQILLGLELGDHALRLEEQHEARVVIHLDVLREEALERHHHVLRDAPAIARLLLEAAGR